ncbi:MAG TPA: response regulator [Flavisolibacter sp.]|jgi:CheY-like chemotaxis protein
MTKSIPPKNIVLYADDDPDDLQLVRDAFMQYSTNVEVVTVRDGTEALAYLKSLGEYDPKPCLVILDINMPRLNGKEALIELRKTERFEDTPVVLFTTSSLPLDKTFAERYKAGFITKPIDARQMELITDNFIEHCTEEIRKNIKRQMK